MRSWVIFCLPALASVPLPAQWTLDAVVHRAGERYAGVQVSLEQASAAATAVQQARTAFLPRGDFYAQLNRATRNNVFGLMLPNPVIPSISGPTVSGNSGSSAWGTAAGFLVQWEPFDLGQRAARVASADAGRLRAERALARTRFEVEAAAADSFLTVLAADETVKSARAAVERAGSLEQIVAAQAKAGLRPEADAARAAGERVSAEMQLVQCEQAARTSRVAVAQLAGGSWDEVRPVAEFASAAPEPSSDGLSASHPSLREQDAAIRESELKKHEADIAWRPRFNSQAALYARGTGANPDGTTGGAAAGLGPSYYNWALGASMIFPLLDLPSIRIRQMEEKHLLQAESARLRKLETDLTAQLERARAAQDAALRIAVLAPQQLDSARAAHSQALARYQSGLTNMVDLADAQRVLLQAEIDNGLARLNVWRARLAVAIAAGDLRPLLEAAKR